MGVATGARTGHFLATQKERAVAAFRYAPARQGPLWVVELGGGRYTFSKVPCILAFCTGGTRALSFQNVWVVEVGGGRHTFSKVLTLAFLYSVYWCAAF